MFSTAGNGDVVEMSDTSAHELSQMIWELERGEFSLDRIETFYERAPKEGPLFQGVARCAVVGAIATGHVVLFDRVRTDLRKRILERMASRGDNAGGTPPCVCGEEIVEIWLQQLLHIRGGESSGVKDVLSRQVPVPWRPVVAGLKIHMCRECGELKVAYVIGMMLLEVCPLGPWGEWFRLYLLKDCAEICRDLGWEDESRRLFRCLVDAAKAHGAIRPFLGLAMGPKTPVEQMLAAEAPELLHRVRRQSDDYLHKLVFFHNRLTAGRITDRLNVREFHLASLLKGGLSYKESAQNMHVSPGRINLIVMNIYKKLNIHSREELKELVW